MAIFKLHTRNEEGQTHTFTYDNQTSELLDETGTRVVKHEPKQYQTAAITSPSAPLSKRNVNTLKISLGLSCNYECSYCSQRFVPHAEETNKADIEPFLAQLPDWFDGGEDGLGTGAKIEFWGGEPLVYIKTLKPLVEQLKAMYPFARISMITNGSLLTPELNEWIDHVGLEIGISHDGPGQHVRGPDPLDDPESREGILDLYRRLHPQRRISINAMLNRENASRGKIQAFLQDIFGEDVPIGEGAFIDPYDEGGMASSLQDPQEKVYYRARALYEMRSGAAQNFLITRTKLADFLQALATNRPATALGQKCGMDQEDKIAVNLKGEVLTCQNVSANSVAPNGQSHRIGHVSDLANVKLNTSTHWSQRPNCKNCPVLQLCQGSCMFLEGPLWWASCENSFNDNLPFLVGAIELLTGFTIYEIDGPQPEHRRRIWEVSEKPKKKVIPIVAA